MTLFSCLFITKYNWGIDLSLFPFVKNEHDARCFHSDVLEGKKASSAPLNFRAFHLVFLFIF